MNIRHYIVLSLLLFGACSTPETTQDAETVEEQPSFLTSFDYTPEQPVDGELLGIIELGYSGFNYFIVTMDKRDRWILERAEFDESFVAEGEITFDRVIGKIETFKSEMVQFGVREDNINLVASSSAIKEQKVVAIAQRLRAMNIGLITVSAEQEGNYALYATIPPAFLKNSYMIDVGSGNTKVSWVEGKAPQTIETYGSKYFQNGVTDEEVSKALRDAIAQVPEANKSVCFLVGKIPYLLAEATNNKNSRYTVLEAPETYSFEDEQQLAGLTIYKAIWEETTFNYVFDWDSNFSIGVLMKVN